MTPIDDTTRKLIRNERIKLTGTYVSSGANAFFAAGVVAPLVVAVFGLPGAGPPIPTLTLATGVLMFFLTSLVMHLAARYILKGVRA